MLSGPFKSGDEMLAAQQLSMRGAVHKQESSHSLFLASVPVDTVRLRQMAADSKRPAQTSFE